MKMYILPLLLLIAVAQGSITYQVFQGEKNPKCDLNGAMRGGNVLPANTPIGSCQEFGQGKSAYNSIKILSCSDTCLCFEQVAGADASVGCDKTRAVGSNIKESCLNQCLVDCNGVNCGQTATSSGTRLMLLGSGQICSNPITDGSYSCATTGMLSCNPNCPLGSTRLIVSIMFIILLIGQMLV